MRAQLDTPVLTPLDSWWEEEVAGPTRVTGKSVALGRLNSEAMSEASGVQVNYGAKTSSGGIGPLLAPNCINTETGDFLETHSVAMPDSSYVQVNSDAKDFSRGIGPLLAPNCINTEAGDLLDTHSVMERASQKQDSVQIMPICGVKVQHEAKFFDLTKEDGEQPEPKNVTGAKSVASSQTQGIPTDNVVFVFRIASY
jgi:hypothetical protein